MAKARLTRQGRVKLTLTVGEAEFLHRLLNCHIIGRDDGWRGVSNRINEAFDRMTAREWDGDVCLPVVPTNRSDTFLCVGDFDT